MKKKRNWRTIRDMSDYSELGKEDLIKIIRKLESRKKYGLIWDEDKVKEQFEKDAENALPVLKEISSKEILDKDVAKPVNILIEGDNYHALSVLNFTHQGKIDVIYIDPPYNTGARDWRYNNDYIDKNDTWRHSKWVSFMNKRLLLAKQLLTEDGVLICTIDHNELPTLGLLLQEIFPDREVTCVTIIHNPSGIQGKNFSHNNEFAYFVHRDDKKVIAAEIRSDEDADVRPFINGAKGNTKNYLRESGYNCFYPILVKNNEIIGFGDVSNKKFHPTPNIKRKDGIIEVYPIDGDGVERKWLFARNSVDDVAGDLSVKFNTKKNIFEIIRTKKDINYKTVWINNKFNAKTYGTQLVQEIIKTDFPFPKSLHAVKECIKAVVHDKRSSTILDFFAGSGTTGHAVLELNKEDGGARSFILCTNNELNGFEKELREKGLSEDEIQEHGICRRVTYPRLEKVINGYKMVGGEKIDGLGGNLKYFKTKFVKNASNRDDFKIRITKECTEMLCLREGVFNEIKKTANYRIFQQGDKTLAVYYSLTRASLPTLKSQLDEIDGDKILYCFTLDPVGLSRSEFAGWHDVTLEPIPQKILDIYKQIYEY